VKSGVDTSYRIVQDRIVSDRIIEGEGDNPTMDRPTLMVGWRRLQ